MTTSGLLIAGYTQIGTHRGVTVYARLEDAPTQYDRKELTRGLYVTFHDSASYVLTRTYIGEEHEGFVRVHYDDVSGSEFPVLLVVVYPQVSSG